MKSSMTRIACALVVITVACVAPLAAEADSARRYSLADLRGSFGSTMDGFVGAAPVAAVGRFTIDGNGHLAGSRTLSLGGMLFQQTYTCDVSVNADGTGDATCSVVTVSPDPLPASSETFDFVIVDKRDRGYFVSTTPGTTIHGVIQRQ